MSKIVWEEVSMNLIVKAGEAKSDAMEGLYAAKEGDFATAKEKIESAEKNIGLASHMHFDVIREESSGVQLEYKVLFMHAEDQLLTTQTLILLVRELIEIYEKHLLKK